MQFFPKTQTLVGKHLHKAIKTPIIIHHAIADVSLALLFGSLFFCFLDDHLPLGEIADHHSASTMMCPPMTYLPLVLLLGKRGRCPHLPLSLLLLRDALHGTRRCG